MSPVEICILIIVILYFRNLWNWIQKRRFRTKFKKAEILINNLESDILDLGGKNSFLLTQIKEEQKQKIELSNQFKEKEELLKKEVIDLKNKTRIATENIKYEKSTLDKVGRYKDLQAQAPRVNSHFLKNVLFKIQYKIKQHKVGNFSLFGKDIFIENKNKKEILPEDVLHNINGLLDYHVLALNVKNISLKEEISQLKNLTEIIQYLKDDLKIEYSFTDVDGLKITPTLLFPFVENALKHGALNEKEAFLKINLININNVIVYEVSNYIINVDKNEKKDGFGLRFLKNTLGTYYPDYEIKNEFLDNTYKATLKIQL